MVNFMFGRNSFIAGVVGAMLMGTPALAGRTAIDQDPDGNPMTAHLSGYCDLNGDDCYDGSGVFLPYQVSIGGADFTNRVIVHGNGLLTFGAPFPFWDDTPLKTAIYDESNGAPTPSLLDYGLTLVSAGQNNTLDFDGVFLQSARLSTSATTGAIHATWFTCFVPTAPGVCPGTGLHSLDLTPVQGGYQGHFDSAGSDRGYVSGGVFTPTESDFFLAATFRGLSLGVPEPGTWVMLTAGFGLMGATLRRRGRQSAA